MNSNEQIRQRIEKLTTLNKISQVITSTLDVQEALTIITDHAIQLLDVEAATVALYEQSTDDLWLTASSGGSADFVRGRRIPANQGVIGWVVQHNEPVLLPDVTQDPRFFDFFDQESGFTTHSILCAPLQAKGQVIGAIEGLNKKQGVFTTEDLELLISLAVPAANAIENARLYQRAQQEIKERKRAEAALEEERTMLAQRVEQRTAQLERQYQRQSRLAEIELAINQPHELQNLLQYVVQALAETLQASAGASILLWNARHEQFFVGAATLTSAQTEALVQVLKAETGHSHWIIENRQPVAVSDLAAETTGPKTILGEAGIRAYAGVPLLDKDEALGVLYLLDRQPRHYSEEDLDFMLALANRVAVAITKVRLYEKLARANAELARAAQLKDEFLAAMSHELRTPLTAILGLSEVLKAEVYGPLTVKQRRSVNSIDESGRHLLSLINDILDLSKIGAGKLELQIGLVPVERVCQASLKLIKQEANKKSLHVAYNCDDRVSLVQADERRLKQILVNLLSNAVKFTPEEGQIGLSVQGDSQRQLLQFAVWDTGIGIDPESKEKLFEPFVQLDSRLARQFTGTGLGLTLVQRMVEMQGGEITVESQMGQGSRFIVSFPWTEQGKTEFQPLEKKDSGPMPVLDPSLLGKKATHKRPLILVAEDEDNVARFVVDYLVRTGYRAIVARNGQEAVQRAKAERPQAIVMDIQMPEMDGLKATRQLRADPDPEVATVPIIALTALAMPGDRDRCLEAGVDVYMSKPVKLKQLVRAIEQKITPPQIRQER